MTIPNKPEKMTDSKDQGDLEKIKEYQQHPRNNDTYKSNGKKFGRQSVQRGRQRLQIETITTYAVCHMTVQNSFN